MTIHCDNKSTKTVLLAIAAELTLRSQQYSATDNRPVKRRTLNMLLVAEKLKTLANGRAVTTLLDYLE